MKFRKYEFLPEKWEELKSLIEVENTFGEETHKSYNHDLIISVVEIGHIVITPAELNDKMEIVKDAILSDKYSVDILWLDEELSEFTSSQIWCEPIGTHSFGASIDVEYIAEYNKRK